MFSFGARAEVRKNQTRTSEFGVFFVHGLAANAGQFASLKRVLAEEVDWFDAHEYSSFPGLELAARSLRRHLDEARARCPALVVIGHSLGGLLLRCALQHEDGPAGVVGFISICAPLNGTHRARRAPLASLRGLSPDASIFVQLRETEHRLDRLRGRILTIGARRDHFVAPYTSAFLERHAFMCLEDSGHLSSLYDARVHEVVRQFVEERSAER